MQETAELIKEMNAQIIKLKLKRIEEVIHNYIIILLRTGI